MTPAIRQTPVAFLAYIHRTDPYHSERDWVENLGIFLSRAEADAFANEPGADAVRIDEVPLKGRFQPTLVDAQP